MAADQPILIKKIKKSGGDGHHGGAWKVAYADFVTAMMAFFLLMWLINTTDPEQKRGIADYFAPASVSPSKSGSGQILAGTSIGKEGAKALGSSSAIEKQSQKSSSESDQSSQQAGEDADNPRAVEIVEARALAEAQSRREQAQFQSAAQSLRQALQQQPELAELSKHIIVEETPEGLRIQLVDQEGRPMFQPGSAQPTERAMILLRATARTIARLPNRIAISGHTDQSVSGLPNYTNWELSSDRANAARRELQDSGGAVDRIAEVIGRAGVEPLYPDDPFDPANRRISILLLREAPVLPPGHRL
ncbi:MAG: flagellar motor protein MotB [Maricaulaceae bacterium]